MVQPYCARKGELVGARIKAGNGDEIAENVVQPANMRRLGNDRQRLIEHFLVISVAWAKHHAMVAKTHRDAVTINCDVPNRENRHVIQRRSALSFCPVWQPGQLEA